MRGKKKVIEGLRKQEVEMEMEMNNSASNSNDNSVLTVELDQSQ